MSISLSIVDGEGILIGEGIRKKYINQFIGNDERVEEAETFMDELGQVIWSWKNKSPHVLISEVDDRIYIYLPNISAIAQNNSPIKQLSKEEAIELVANELYEFMEQGISKRDCLEYTKENFSTQYDFYVS